ncbi:CBS domain-containing protein [Variovorax sp. PAMC28562]|nr:CBS domain-containing protein [Variovorax sp. PAMC28562]
MGEAQGQGPSFRSRQRELNTKLVSSIEAATRSRLRTVTVDALLREVARLLSNTQISLVVVCDEAGAMAGVVTKTDIVRQISDFEGAACARNAADVMTRNVTFCRATDSLPNVLTMMQVRGLVHVPVIDAAGTPTGVVNARDALRELLAEGKYEEALLRDYVMGVGYR